MRKPIGISASSSAQAGRDRLLTNKTRLAAAIGVLALGACGGGGGGGGGGGDGGPTKLSTLSTRITQGLDIDIGDKLNLLYDLISGKDTLLRVEFEASPISSGMPSVNCDVAKFGGSAPDLTSTPTWKGPAEIKELPSEGFLSKRFRADCWIPGTALHPHAAFQFQAVARFGDQPEQALFAGPKAFKQTADVRLLVVPTTWPDGDIGNSEAHPWTFCFDLKPEDMVAKCPKRVPDRIYRAWDSNMAVTLMQTLVDLQRVMPVRAGVGPYDDSGSALHTSATPGLRFLLNPVIECKEPYATSTSGLRDVVNPCDMRPLAALMVGLLNAKLDELDKLDSTFLLPNHRDRFDKSLVVTPNNPQTTGGQCRGGDWVGAEIDERANGPSSFVVIQELAHCLGGLVHADSPHSIPLDAAHSLNSAIPLLDGLPLVNMETHANIPDPLSVMYPWFDGSANSSRIAFEGFEWNAMHQTLLTMPRWDTYPYTYTIPEAASASVASATTIVDRYVDSGAPANSRTALRTAASPDAAGPRYVIAGGIDGGDSFHLRYSQRIDNVALRMTPADPHGAYALVLRDAAGQELSRLPFDRGVETGHTHGPGEWSPVMLVVPVSGQPATIELERQHVVLYRIAVSNTPPIVSNVRAQLDADTSHVDLTWVAPNANEPVLYNVFYQPSPDKPEMLAAAGLKQTHLRMSTFLLGATPQARLIVEASNGYRTTRATSGAVSIPLQPPIIGIRSPRPNGPAPAAGETITLVGSALDFTFGMLSDDDLSWKSDRDGPLGHGARLTTRLSAGVHQLTLEAKAHGSTKSASRTVSVNVAAAER